MMTLMDTNHDGVIDKMEALRFSLSTEIAASAAKLDKNLDGKLTLAELKIGLAGIATNAEIAAWMKILDTNGDGVLSKLEALPLNIANNLSAYFNKLDANMDGKLTFAELKAGLGPMATDAQIRLMMSLMDTNHDGMISVEEASKFKLGSIDDTQKLAKLDSARLHQVELFTAGTRDHLFWVHNALGENAARGMWGIAADTATFAVNSRDYLSYIWGKQQSLDAHAANIVGKTAATVTTLGAVKSDTAALPSSRDHLGNISALSGHLGHLPNLGHLPGMASSTGYLPDSWTRLGNISSYTSATNSNAGEISSNTGTANNAYLVNINAVAGASKTLLEGIATYTVNARDYLSYLWGNASYGAAADYAQHVRVARNVQVLAIKMGAAGMYATGGIASGPASGYQATLHGTEAIIPLGDGNSVTAHLTAPLPNYIAQEAGDGPALRQALAELQEELAALRGDQRAIGAATVGELKDHNKRERKRDVIPQVVEIAP